MFHSLRAACLLLAAAAAATAAPTTLPGIDVSVYQGAIDWPAVAAAGIKFVSIKATEGTTETDPRLAANWAGARAANITRTAYHFAHPSLPAEAQAEHFVAAVVAAGGLAPNTSTMQLMLDLEDADHLPPAQVWAWVRAFMARLQALTGRPGIIYTGYYFWRDDVGNPTDNLNAPLWIAAYTPAPLVPPAWRGWTFWQHTSSGSVPGITGRVDLDTFAGTPEELARLCF
jgi:lysozyme